MSNDEISFADLQIDTLTGDVRDALLMRIREMKRPWSMLVAAEQRELAAAMDIIAKNLVTQTVQLLTDFPFPRVAVRLGEVKLKGGEKGIEAKITCDDIQVNRNTLGDHVGSYVLMLMVDSETFDAERAPVAIVDDQGRIPGMDR